MAHVLIAGMTLSGKTTLAKRLAAAYRAAGINVFVLDPILDPQWNADFITDDQEHFLDVFWANRSAMAFLDEGGESVGRYDLAMQKTATRGRHRGHVCHYIVQDATQIAPIIRAQCTRLFLFCSPYESGVRLSRDWNRPELLECSNLSVGEYFEAVKMGAIRKCHLFNKRSAGNESTSDDLRRSSDASRPRTSEREEERVGSRKDAERREEEQAGDDNDGDAARER